MIEDKNVATDEERRSAQHAAVKSAVRANLDAEISREAAHSTPADHARTGQVAESLKHKAVQEVARTEAELDRGKSIARASQIVDYVFYLIYGVIGLEIVLNALGARQ